MMEKDIVEHILDEETQEIVLSSEFLEKAIDETIEFDKKLQDPEFRKKMDAEKERMKNIDFSMFFKDDIE